MQTSNNVLIATEGTNSTSLPAEDLEHLETIVKQIYNLAKIKKQQELNDLQEQLIIGIEQMKTATESINALAVNLESEILKFAKIASEVNKVYHTMQQPSNLAANKSDNSKSIKWRPLNIWQIHSVAIPNIVRRHSKFILDTKTIDLFP